MWAPFAYPLLPFPWALANETHAAGSSDMVMEKEVEEKVVQLFKQHWADLSASRKQ